MWPVFSLSVYPGDPSAVSDMAPNPSQEAQEGGGDDEWEVISVTGSQAHPDPDPEVDTKTGQENGSQAGMSHFIVKLLEEDACEWHCDDDCPFIVRSFRRRRLRNCKTCTPNDAIDADVVYCTPTGKCIHKDSDCRYLRHSARISAKKCEHCFRESSLA